MVVHSALVLCSHCKPPTLFLALQTNTGLDGYFFAQRGEHQLSILNSLTTDESTDERFYLFNKSLVNIEFIRFISNSHPYSPNPINPTQLNLTQHRRRTQQPTNPVLLRSKMLVHGCPWMDDLERYKHSFSTHLFRFSQINVLASTVKERKESTKMASIRSMAD